MATMGLSGSFGKQAYQCSSCGARAALWSPHCPSCLNTTLRPLNKEASLGPVGGNSTTAPAQARRAEKQPSNLPMIIGLALLVAIGCATYVLLTQKVDFSSIERVTTTQPVATPHEVRRVVRRTVKPAVKAVSRPTASAAPAAATSAVPTRRPGPMKLWQNSTSGDDEE